MVLRKASSDRQSLDGHQKFEQQQITLPRQNLLAAHALLAEIHDLLEEYGPTWYSEELSDKLASVMSLLEEEL